MPIKKTCQWYPPNSPRCDKEATIYVKIANTSYCDEHYLDAILHLGCDLKGERINATKHSD